MKLLLTGLSHRTAPVEIREKAEVPEGDLPRALEEIRSLPGVREAMLLSTCNRVEIMAVTEGESGASGDLRRWLSGRLGESRPSPGHLYQHEGEDAVRHLFRVASSLDSLMLGEPQILGQVKAAHRVALEQGASGAVLHRVLARAYHAAKRVRTETALAKAAVSVSYAATELARHIFDNLANTSALIVGAGEMGILALRHLVEKGTRKVHVANRTLARAQEVAAEFGGTASDLSGVPAALVDADVVISCTGAQRHLITREDVQAAMKKRRGKPMFLIDISVPRNIEPRAGELESVYLYDIDDLQAVVDRNLGSRKEAARAAEEIVEAEVSQYRITLGGARAAPVVRSLVRKAERVREGEVQRTVEKFGDYPEEQQQRLRSALDVMTQALIKKLLHHPILTIKEMGAAGDDEGLELASRMMGTEGADLAMVVDEGDSSGQESSTPVASPLRRIPS